MYRLCRSASGGQRRLELRGQRLLVGPADTGIFKIAAHGASRPQAVAGPAPRRRRDEGDGLAPASIEIFAPLAIVDDE